MPYAMLMNKRYSYHRCFTKLFMGRNMIHVQQVEKTCQWDRYIRHLRLVCPNPTSLIMHLHSNELCNEPCYFCCISMV